MPLPDVPELTVGDASIAALIGGVIGGVRTVFSLTGRITKTQASLDALEEANSRRFDELKSAIEAVSARTDRNIARLEIRMDAQHTDIDGNLKMLINKLIPQSVNKE